MKTNQLFVVRHVLAPLMVLALLAAQTIRAGEPSAQTNSPSLRIGVYDSRAVAYAHFSSASEQQARDERAKAARAAQTAGESERSKQIGKELSDQQKKIHLQVFSTAPAREAMTALQPRLPAIQKQAGVTDIVSKWDREALKKYSAAEQVDVTDLLVREFKLTEAQQQTALELQKKKPVSAAEAESDRH